MFTIEIKRSFIHSFQHICILFLSVSAVDVVQSNNTFQTDGSSLSRSAPYPGCPVAPPTQQSHDAQRAEGSLKSFSHRNMFHVFYVLIDPHVLDVYWGVQVSLHTSVPRPVDYLHVYMMLQQTSSTILFVFFSLSWLYSYILCDLRRKCAPAGH